MLLCANVGTLAIEPMTARGAGTKRARSTTGVLGGARTTSTQSWSRGQTRRRQPGEGWPPRGRGDIGRLLQENA